MINIKDSAILFSGGTDSLALYAMSFTGSHTSVPKPERIHLLNMLNGMSRFPHFTKNRFDTAKIILESHSPKEKLPESLLIELDSGRLFQGLWLDRYEEFMPRYNGKNLVCVACKAAMHTRAIIYCLENDVKLLMAGYTKKQSYYPEQTPTFMDAMNAFSEKFGIRTTYPVFEDFSEETVSKHYLEDQGLPSTGGGERKCLFSQTYTTATENETGRYLSDMLPVLEEYIKYKIAGEPKAAAECFRPGRIKEMLIA
ncbi:hypothetical protein [Desulforegula conservatrix]|uniref:hypothetical protein n=1 Tax=Desulforegula conservatrix TaxID=153026 RepID=UPI0004208129|nr:hypothetical protein [Desulforegula conservatrix]